MFPHLNLGKDGSLPRGAKDIGQGYTLLRACQNTPEPVMDAEANAILKYWEETMDRKHGPGGMSRIRRIHFGRRHASRFFSFNYSLSHSNISFT